MEANSSVQHVRLSDASDDTTPPFRDNDNDHSFSSIICHVIPVALLKATSSMVSSSLTLAIPLYAIRKYPDHSSLIAGIVITMNGIGIMLATTFIGHLIASTSDEFCTIISVIIRTAFLLFLCVIDDHLSIWIVVTVIFGICQGSIQISMNHILASKIKSKKRGRITSVVAGCSRSGRAIGPLYVGYISDLRIALLLSAAISIFSLFLLCCVMLPPKINVDTTDLPDGVSSGSCPYFKAGWSQSVLCLESIRNDAVVYGIFGFGLKWVRQTRKLILTFRGDELALSNAQIGTTNSLSFLMDCFMFLPAGYVMDRFGRKATAVPGLIGFVAALILLNFARNYKELLVISGVFGISDGITVGLMMTSAADLAPSECKSEFIAAFKVFTTLPTIIAPSVVGALCNQVSILSASLLSAGIGTIALFWIAFILEDPSKHNARNEVKAMNAVNGLNGNEKQRDNVKNAIRMSTLDEQLIIADEDCMVNLEKEDGI